MTVVIYDLTAFQKNLAIFFIYVNISSHTMFPDSLMTSLLGQMILCFLFLVVCCMVSVVSCMFYSEKSMLIVEFDSESRLTNSKICW